MCGLTQCPMKLDAKEQSERPCCGVLKVSPRRPNLKITNLGQDVLIIVVMESLNLCSLFVCFVHSTTTSFVKHSLGVLNHIFREKFREKFEFFTTRSQSYLPRGARERNEPQISSTGTPTFLSTSGEIFAPTEFDQSGTCYSTLTDHANRVPEA